MPVKPLSIRLYIQILIFTAMVSLGVLVLWPVQQYLNKGMLNVRDNLINMLEDSIGRKISYSFISPSIFGSFDVRNVKIIADDESHSVLDISRFRVAYSFFDLLRGSPRAIQSIQIDSPHVYLDYAKDSDLFELFRNINNTGIDSFNDFSEMLPDKILVQINNGIFHFYNEKNRYEINAFNFNTEISSGQIAFNGAWNANATIDKIIGDPVRFGMVMQIDGSLSSDFEQGSAVFTIPMIAGDIQSNYPVSLGVSLQDNEIRAFKNTDKLPVDLSLVYRTEKNDMMLLLGCMNLSLNDYLSFHGSLKGASQFLDIAINGNASIGYNDDEGLKYQIGLKGSAGNDRTNMQRASVEIFAQGDRENVNIDSVRLSMPKEQMANAFFYGDINFTGTVGLEQFAPNGRLSFDNFSFSGNEEIKAVINISAEEDQINIFSDRINAGKLDLGAFRALVKRSGDETSISVSAQQAAGRREILSLNGVFNSGTNSLVSNFKLSNFSLGSLSDIALVFSDELPVPSMLAPLFNSAFITAEASLSTNFNNIAYNVPLLNISSSADGGFSGSLSLSGTEKELAFTNGEIVWHDEKLKMSGNAGFSNPGDFNFHLNADYGDLDYFIRGIIRGGRSVDITGSYGLSVNLSSPQDRDGYSGYMQAENFPLPFIGQPALFSSRLQIYYSSPSAWTMLMDKFEISGITQHEGKAELRFTCRADQNGANISDIFYRDAFGPLRGKGEVSWVQDFSKLSGNLNLGETRESYSLDAAYSNSLLELSLDCSSMRFDRLFGRDTRAIADMNVHVSYDFDKSINADLNISSIRGKFLDVDYRASVSAKMDNEKITVNALKMNFSELEVNMPSLVITPSKGLAETAIGINGILARRPIHSNMSLNVNFTPVNSWFEIADAMESFSGKVIVSELIYGITGEPQTFEAAFSMAETATGNGFSLTAGPRDMIRMRFDKEGNFFASLSNPFPVRGTIVGSIKDDMINARCADFFVDLAEVFKLLPEDRDVDMAGGYINGYIDIRGSLSDPEFYGVARAHSIRMQVPYIFEHDIRPIPFNVNINGKEIVVNRIPASVGNGAGSVSGIFEFDRWIPNIFSLDIEVPANTAAPFDLDIIGFTAKGIAWGNVNLTMENLTLYISGNMNINNTQMGYYYDEELIDSTANTFANLFIPIVIDITVTTGPQAEFVYPASYLPILRATLDNRTKVHITADSITEKFSVTSDVQIRSGEMFYFERSFYIRSGTMILKENEQHFDPRISVRAELRDRYEGSPVTLAMIVDDSPLLEFTPRFESTPPLTQTEIFAMMGQNITGGQYDDQTGSIQRAFLSSTSDIFAQFVVVRQLEQRIRNFMRLDMFSVRTQVLQNAFFSATGLIDPVDRIGGVGNYFDNTTIFGGKYIGQDLFIQGMLSMQYDVNKTSLGGLTLRPDIGFELQNPLFSIRWDFMPSSPENWFVNDNSITLTWRRSF